MHDRRQSIAPARGGGFSSTSGSMALDVTTEFACSQDPDRWMTRADEGAKALCRACPRRWLCAREACTTPGAEGLWAGILIPEAGRGRQFALKQLRNLAECHGLPVRSTPQ